MNQKPKTLLEAIQAGLDEYTKRCQENPGEKLPAAEIIQHRVLEYLNAPKTPTEVEAIELQ